MKYRSLHLQGIETVETADAKDYCFLVCTAPSGGSLDVRLPLAEAKKLHAMLERIFEPETATM